MPEAKGEHQQPWSDWMEKRQRTSRARAVVHQAA
jgi:hypothetical protein